MRIDSERHHGKVALVTGGASGIGLGIVERLLAEGASVVSFDMNETVTSNPAGRFLSLTGNAVNEKDVEAAVDQTIARFGSLDIMVCNAGVIEIAPVVDTPYETWRRVMNINVDSVFLGSRAAARRMIDQRTGGVIVNASSGAGRRGVPNLAAYCASKAAIIMLTQSLAVELAPHRIRANCYVPGHIETPFWSGITEGFSKVTGRSSEEVLESFRATVPWGRFGSPDDVAATVTWLASEDAEYVSGQAIAMNGAEFPY